MMIASKSGSLQRGSSLGREKDADRKHDDSLLKKIGGTLGRSGSRKKVNDEGEDEGKEVEIEGKYAIDSSGISLPINLLPQQLNLDEGQERRLIACESLSDHRIKEIIQLLIDWINDELADQRILVKDIQEDLFDGLVIQKLLEKFTGIKMEVPEVSQSEEGQRQKLNLVLGTANRLLAQSQFESSESKWPTEAVHSKDLVAILHLLIALALHFRAPIRFPEFVAAQMVVVSKKEGQIHTRQLSPSIPSFSNVSNDVVGSNLRTTSTAASFKHLHQNENDRPLESYITEELTTSQSDLGLKGERDAFDTLFDYGPDKLEKIKSSIAAFCNKHLLKINLEVTDLDTQFQDGVFLVLLMGLLEGYFVPLYSFHLQVSSHQHKVQNVAFVYELMQEAGMPKPRSRPQDIANGDLKSTLRILHSLFAKYKFV